MNFQTHLILCSTVLFFVTGCQKNIQRNTTNPGEIFSTIQSICPRDRSLDYDDAYEVFHYRQESTEGIACDDGKLYCYGQDNEPIVQPQPPDGWQCRYVASMPGKEKYLREYMYYKEIPFQQPYESDYHRYIRKYTQWAYMKAWVCEQEAGCLCGENACPQNGLCVEGQCYCHDERYSDGKCSLVQPLIEHAYGFEDGFVEVEEESRYDDEDLDHDHAIDITSLEEDWMASSQHDYPRREINGKWIQYGSVVTYSYELVGPDEGEDLRYDRKIQFPTDAVWYDILTNQTAQECDHFPIPDNVEDYVCTFDAREDGCHEASQMYVGSAGFRCIKPDGCRCGNRTIPMHAGCRNGKVDYDALYQTLACHREINYYFSESESYLSQLVDNKGWCRCGRSTVPPNMKGYFCDHSGMVCKRKAGCACGDAVCQYDETCLKPGECKKYE